MFIKMSIFSSMSFCISCGRKSPTSIFLWDGFMWTDFIGRLRGKRQTVGSRLLPQAPDGLANLHRARLETGAQDPSPTARRVNSSSGVRALRYGAWVPRAAPIPTLCQGPGNPHLPSLCIPLASLERGGSWGIHHIPNLNPFPSLVPDETRV